MAEEERREEPRKLLEEAIDAYLGRLPPRYALSAVLRTVWSRPEFVKLRKELSERSRELASAYRSAAEEVGLGARYREVAESVKIHEKFREAWRK